jgi:hypothetical protein
MAKSRKVSSISKEFDGKEVQGKLIERSGLLGSKVSKEVFKMPGGGKHIEKTRTNKKGDVVSRLSRDTKVNPLKLFNDNKQQAIKKAGGEMSAYKKSLKTFQGDVTGSQVASAASNAANSINPSNNTNNVNLNNANTPRPRLSDITPFAVDLNQGMEIRDKGVMNRGDISVKAASMNSGPGRGAIAESRAGYQKKGGSVKKMSKGGPLKPVPSDKVGLSKLPTPVRNKMGYQKKGGSVKRKK